MTVVEIGMEIRCSTPIWSPFGHDCHTPLDSVSDTEEERGSGFLDRSRR